MLFDKEVDYLVVGGGSSGCAVSQRLAQANHQVLLLEAGPRGQNMITSMPFGSYITVPWRLYNWHYHSVPQRGLSGRMTYQPRGKVLGGSSAINAMVYIRGQAQDYDHWQDLGNQGWSYQDVLPWFKKSENNQRIQNDYHGNDGPLYVSDLQSPNPASQAFVEACQSYKIPHNQDFNGAQQYGAGLYQVTQYQGKRCSVAKAYLDDPRAPQVWTQAQVIKLLFDGKRCMGLKVKHRRKILSIRAKKEVILSAGAFGSPHILLHSGIGANEQLKPLGIDVVHELPGVGKNLQDHPDYILNFTSNSRDLMGFTAKGLWDIGKAFFEYRKHQTGMLSSNFAEGGAFLKSQSELDRPDLQLHFVVGLIEDHARKVVFKHGFGCHVCLLRPKSKGSLRLVSANPMDTPAIDPNYLSDEQDIKTLLRGFRITRNILYQKALAPFREQERDSLGIDDDERLYTLLKARTESVYHPVGTCKMGHDEEAVVDDKLRVHGIEGLRIVDASIMPEIISGNTNAPSVMIGEKAAHMILNA